MHKEKLQPESEIKRIVNFAEHLRAKMIIPSLELENLLNFQNSQILNKNLFHPCTAQKTPVTKAFKRAFKTMTPLEQANYYSKCVKITLKEIYSTNDKHRQIQNVEDETQFSNEKSQKFEQLSVLVKRKGSFQKWALSKIELASEISVLRLVHTGEQLDLHNYILRESKSKEKPAIVLQATDEMAPMITLRLSNYYESFGEFKAKIQCHIDKALRENVSLMLKRNRSSMTSIRSSIQGQIHRPPKQMLEAVSFKKNKGGNQEKPATLLLLEGSHPKSMRQIITEASKRSFPEHVYKKIHCELVPKEKLFGLSSFKDFQEVSKDVYFNKKSQITRRVFRFEESEVSYEWLVTSMNCYKMFKKWKSCLFLINLLAEFSEEKTKIYHEINLYKDYSEVDYVFLRHLFELDGANYYVDKSINTEEYGRVSNGSRGWIEQCIWRFRKIGSSIEVLVQVEFGDSLSKKNTCQMATQFIGEVSLLRIYYSQDKNMKSSTLKTIYNNNLFLFEDQSEFNGKDSEIGSPLKKQKKNSKSNSLRQSGQRQSKQIRDLKQEKGEYPQFLDEENMEANMVRDEEIESEYADTNFYTIEDDRSNSSNDVGSQDWHAESDQNEYKKDAANGLQGQESQNALIQKFDRNSMNKPSQQNESSRFANYPNSIRYLFARHIVNCQVKNLDNKPRETTQEKGHYIWRKEWKITDKGQLININQEQIKVQSSVLKLVVKRMGRNILSGKSVLNISLPIQIFGTDSNLERLCKSMAYGPRFLEPAVHLESPVERMKRVMCFALGFSICYIQMQKPFNPILGQTYQGVIDGCPIYGEQISHHPPISSVLLKGRGYTVYANLQAKVDMGLNSASGINDGTINVSFSQTDLNSKVITFTSPPGELSGLVVGERKLTLIKKSYYLDRNNMLLGVIEWGSQKKKNQISFNNDYFEGKIIQLKPDTDLSRLDKIKDTQFQMVHCEVKGRWTDKVWFGNQVLFDVQTDGPYNVDQQLDPLPSNVHFREDIILRKKDDLILAQQAKQRLEEIQRNDRKLRKNYERSS